MSSLGSALTNLKDAYTLPFAPSARVFLGNERATRYDHCCKCLASRREASGSPPGMAPYGRDI